MGRRWFAPAAVVGALAFVGGAGAQNYIVLYKAGTTSPFAALAIQKAGGSLRAAYGQIGVAIASSSSPSFGARLRRLDATVAGAAGTARFPVKLHDTLAPKDARRIASDPAAAPPASDTDPFSRYQWDMRQIHTPEAHAITGGSRSVLVGDIDTGLDYLHPDLKANVDVANSVNCVGGSPQPGAAAALDDNGHGTHTAGTIAAAANGIGIVGVAPNVRIAGIKAGNQAGFFYQDAVVCAFMWAGTHHFDVTNNSYFADPFYFNCPKGPQERTILQAIGRSVRFAQQNGVTVVAALGNFSDDLAHPTQDRQSPDDSTPVTRPVDESCIVLPVQLPGVIGVSATGNLRMKSYYSNYGTGVVDVAAPGGDRRLKPTPEDPLGGGRVLSTYPADQPCTRVRVDPVVPTATYCYLQGTSMASPHVAGLAALVISRFGHMEPAEVQSLIERTADPQPCPTELGLYAPFPSVNNDAPQHCEGPPNNNSWYGHGIVNALTAVTAGGNNNNH